MPNALEKMINQAEIPGVSVARLSGDGNIATETAGVINTDTQETVKDITVFEAASLSKPVFAYIVLKMVERGELDLDRPLFEYSPAFGPPNMRSAEQYKQLTARTVLSHQAGLPNEFDPARGIPFAYVSKVGERFDYSGEAFCFLLDVVQTIKAPKTLEDLAQEEFVKIGMTHSSFSPPTGCDLIKLSDDELPPTPERLGPLLTSQISIICAGDKLYVAEKAADGLSITEKSPGESDVEIAQFESMKATIKSLPATPFSRPAEARDLQLVTAIIGHRPKDCVESLAIGHLDEGEANPNQRFYRVHPAGSLYTTAEDYAKFLRQCTTDEFVRKEMFTPAVPSLADKDDKAIKAGVSSEVLGQIAWGVGIGLQQTPDGKSIAFHWGDNHTGRNFAAIDLATNQAVVCLTNSVYGPSVFQKIAEPVVGSLTPVSQWLSRREGLCFDDHVSLSSSSRTDRHDLKDTIESPKKTDAESNNSEVTSKYRDNLREIRRTQPGYMEPTQSSMAKEREKFSPFQTTPKPPWKA